MNEVGGVAREGGRGRRAGEEREERERRERKRRRGKREGGGENLASCPSEQDPQPFCEKREVVWEPRGTVNPGGFAAHFVTWTLFSSPAKRRQQFSSPILVL